MSLLTVMRLRVLDAVCLLSAAAVGAWLIVAFFGPRVFVPAGVPHPVSFSPAAAPDWMLWLAIAVIVALLAVSLFVIDPAVDRVRARTEAQK